MQAKKELLLFTIILLISIGLLVASGNNKQEKIPARKCETPLKCCHKSPAKHPDATPWNMLTEGVLHFAAL